MVDNRVPPEHGSPTAARAERARGLAPCLECKQAEAAARRAKRAADPESYRRSNRADSRAKALLVRRHHEEYRALFRREYMRDEGPRS